MSIAFLQFPDDKGRHFYWRQEKEQGCTWLLAAKIASYHHAVDERQQPFNHTPQFELMDGLAMSP